MRERLQATVLAVALAVLVAMTALPVLAQEADGPPACPLTEGIVLNAQGDTWGLNYLRSNRSVNHATMGPGAAVVPAGTYDVVLVAWDSHGPEDETQPNEQWLLRGLDDAGSIVFTSGATPDIADDEMLVVATVNSGVEISGFTQVEAFHAAFRDRSSPNSVWPLCAALVPVTDPDPDPDPEPDPEPDPQPVPLPDPIVIGDLVWDDANADGHQADFEFGVAGVTVNLLNADGALVATAVTGSTGEYLFTGMRAGTYSVEILLPDGFELGPATGAGPVTVAGGQSDLTKDFGIFRTPEVLPQVVTTTTAAAPATTAAVTQETLPFTGVSTAGTGAVAAALILLGGLTLLVGSGRRRPEAGRH